MSIKTLERLVICHIDCSIWSGRKKLRPEDLRLVNGSQLPSKDVASLGSKKICDPEALARFERLKKEAQRLCEQVGVRFLGGYAVPEQHTDSILAGLDKVSRAFAQCKQQFLADYDQVTLDWMDKHPEFAEAIRRAISPVDEVAARLQFDYALYRMQAAGDAGQLHSKVSGMGHTLLREVARDANELFERSVAGKQQISQRALNPLQRMRDKLDGLAFLDHRVQPMVQAIDQLRPRLPATGPITGALYHELMATILILADPEKMRLYGEGQLAIDQLLPPSGSASPVPSHLPLQEPATPNPGFDWDENADHTTLVPVPSPAPAGPTTAPGSFYF